MKRDHDLVRKIILHLESKPDDFNLDAVNIEGYSRKTVSYHIGLLQEAGYVRAMCLNGDDQQTWFAEDLTWQGHEFADLLRSESLWGQVKEKIGNAAGTLTIDALKFTLTEAMSGRLQNYFNV